MNEARLKMELHKVVREIKTHGEVYNLFREKLDKYGEPTEEKPEQVATIQGLLHVSKGYITENIQEGTKTHSKGQPMLLVAFEGTENICNGDYFEINENRYKVVEKNNIQEYNILTDISLELVLNGRN